MGLQVSKKQLEPMLKVLKSNTMQYIIKKFITLILLAIIFFTPHALHAKDGTDNKYKATVSFATKDQIKVTIDNKELGGKEYVVKEYGGFLNPTLDLRVGQKVYVMINSDGRSVLIIDQYRVMPLIILAMVFVLTVFLIGRKKGILSIIAMVVSFFVIINAVVPQILLGNNPVLISLLASLIIIPFNFYLSHGVNKKTTIAVVSTFMTLILAGVLSMIFVYWAKLTGYASEEATFLTFHTGQTVNIKALLLSGIIIGAMGVLDDITISQASIVAKLKKANPKFDKWELFKESMDIGRDHIASLVNTLILVYAGASLPLFILFSGFEFGNFEQIVNMEIVATEIVRTLVSSIAIICAVPITTYLAVIKS